MKRFLLAAAVAAASLTIAPCANAQLPREAGFNEIFSTDFMPKDMSLFVDFLDKSFEGGEGAILHADFLAHFVSDRGLGMFDTLSNLALNAIGFSF